MLLAIGILAAICIVAAVLLKRRHQEPDGWTAGPLIGGRNYSAGVTVDADGSFDFPQSPHSVHYVTRACESDLTTKTAIRLRYRIDAEPSTAFLAASDGKSPAIGPVLYIQRKGDDWSGRGKFETYRWWATFAAMPITPGEHEIVAPLSARWTAVETSNAGDDRDAFRGALADTSRVGFTFGGGTGYGHGAYAVGKARFTLLGFELVA